MTSSLRLLKALSWLAGATVGCSAAGDSPGTVFQVDDTGAAGTTSVSPAPPDPAPAGGPPSTKAPPAAAGAESCATASAAVVLVRQPVDIVIVLDNSGSMDDEARAVEGNINDSFAQILRDSGVDYRVILISEHRERNLQDTAVCISSPLSTLAQCPSEAPGTSDRFFQYSTEIGSRDSFEVLLETYDGARQDDFDLAPGGWSEWLRPEAKKVFLEISDDDSGLDAAEFVASLTALAPEAFGADPAQPSFVWHSIVGIAERPVNTDPYAPNDPIETRECTGDVSNAGATYQELSQLTGGLRFPICAFDGYDAVFRRIAGDVVESSRDACDFAIPAPPAGRALDLDKVSVAYQPGSGGAVQQLGQVTSAALCDTGAFVLDGGGVHLCPDACAVVAADDSARVDVLFTCASTVLR